ncbi:MAG: tetratricopeptide repeat protein [Methanocorpusculum sp.]|nr:tetratricopeptide repeat protein [Methanocorpusculum sp.]
MTYHPASSPYFWEQTADACFAQERWQKAADAYLRLIELTPGNAGAWQKRGLALQHLGRLPDAADCLEHALLLCPDTIETLQPLADILGALKDTDRQTACLIRLGELRE